MLLLQTVGDTAAVSYAA